MTPTLIDQLKLAIQVESGEVDWKEVQLREKTKGAPWNDILSPPSWTFNYYEYRRKPKPFEVEVVVVDGRIFGIRGTIHEGTDCKIVKMREVIE